MMLITEWAERVKEGEEDGEEEGQKTSRAGLKDENFINDSINNKREGESMMTLRWKQCVC